MGSFENLQNFQFLNTSGARGNESGVLFQTDGKWSPNAARKGIAGLWVMCAGAMGALLLVLMLQEL